MADSGGPVAGSVIIPNWNGVEALRRALTGLRAMDAVEAPEVIVVDNGSTDGSREMAARGFPEVRWVSLERNEGFCRACNRGFREARGRYVGLLNNDAVPDPAWWREAVAALERDPTVGIVASKIYLQDRPTYIDSAGDRVNIWGVGVQRGHGQKDRGQFDRPEPVFSASGCAAVYRKKMLEAIGGFDERFFAYYEDVDLAWRARRAGWRCQYVPTAKVWHQGGHTSRRNASERVYLIQRNQEWVLMKHATGFQAWRWGPHALFAVVSWVNYALRGLGGVVWRAKRDAWKDLTRRDAVNFFSQT